MCGVYTTINPETGDFTEEKDFVNSWKWKYKDFTNQKDSEGQLNLISSDPTIDGSRRRALISKYWLDRDTTEDMAHRFHKLSQEKNEASDKLYLEREKVRELFSALQSSVIHCKDIKKELSSNAKQKKKFKKEIINFLSHKESCLIFSLEVLGRTSQNAECNCGLKEILKRI